MQSEAEVFGGEDGAKRRQDLQSRVTEHNILVVSKYYGQTRIARLATLLDLPEDKVRNPSFVCSCILVWASTLEASNGESGNNLK